LLTAQKLFPLLTIHREAISNEVCYIGKLVAINEKTFTMYDIDPDANWDRVYRRKMSDLTKLILGAVMKMHCGV
jgi:hypothetical protein